MSKTKNNEIKTGQIERAWKNASGVAEQFTAIDEGSAARDIIRELGINGMADLKTKIILDTKFCVYRIN